MDEALDPLTDLNEGSEWYELCDTPVDEFADLVGRGKLLPWILLGRLERKADSLAAHVNLQDLYVDLVADGHDRARMVDVLP